MKFIAIGELWPIAAAAIRPMSTPPPRICYLW